MKLSNTKLQYSENGAYVDVQELISCDVTFLNSPSRSNWDREGTWINDTIDTITINFKRGYNTLLDALKGGMEIPLKWNNGAFSYSGTFICDTKINTKKGSDTITYISFEPKEGTDIELVARGTGPGGHIDSVYVIDDTGKHYVVDDGEADINLVPYAKSTSVESGLNNKVSKSGDTMTGNLSMGGHLIQMLGGRIINLANGSDDDAVNKKYVDQKVASIDISGKIDKTTTANQIYGTKTEGTSTVQTTLTYDTAATPNTIAMRDDSGRLTTTTPTAYSHVTPKKYVDDLADTKQGKLTALSGITLSGNNISADTSVLATKTDLTYKQNKLTAGTYISIDGNSKISCTVQDELDKKIDKTAIVDSVTSESTTQIPPLKTIKDLNDRINNLSAGGRYLSGWDCANGKPQTNPPGELPYTYRSGDYYIIYAVGTTNYKPSGSTYDGTASSVVETGNPSLNDYYRYDGTTWSLVKAAASIVEFSTISGDAKSNASLKGYLDGLETDKQDKLTAGDNIDITNNIIKAKDVVTTNTEQAIEATKTFTDLLSYEQLSKINGAGLDIRNTSTGTLLRTFYVNGAIQLTNGDNEYELFLPEKDGTFLVSSDLEKVVTTDTNQSISGTKTFETSSAGTDSMVVTPEKITAIKYFVNEGERLTTLSKTDYKSTGITSYVVDTAYNLAFPNKSGVIALTSDIPSLTGDFVPRVTTTSPSTELEDKTIMYDGANTASWTRGHIYHSYPVYYWEHNCTDAELGTTFVAYTRKELTSTPTTLYYDVACEMPTLYDATTTRIYSSGTSIPVGDVTSSTRKIDGNKWEDITPTTDLSNYYTKTQTNNLFQTFYDGIYPVGSVYFGFQAPGVPSGVTATWTLQTTYNAKALWVDTTKTAGTAISQELPKPTLTFTGSSATTSSNGAHTHTRGTMEITGTMGSICNQNGTATGCFTYKRDNNAELSGSNQSRGTWTFTASNNWTGETSSGGAHTHTVTAKGSVTCNTSGPYGSGTIVQPPAVAISCWKRTA